MYHLHKRKNPETTESRIFFVFVKDIYKYGQIQYSYESFNFYHH